MIGNRAVIMDENHKYIPKGLSTQADEAANGLVNSGDDCFGKLDPVVFFQ